MMNFDDFEEEQEENEIHLPEDESDWASKLERHTHATSIRLFVDEMPEEDLMGRCKDIGRKFENLTSLLICPYNEFCPIIRATAELLQLRKNLEELRLWFSEPVTGKQADYDFLFQQLEAASSLKEFEMLNSYEWKVEDGTLEETQLVPWILQSILSPLNKLTNLQDVAFSTFPLTQTKETEAALIQLCQKAQGKPDLTLNIFDSELSSTFLNQVCGENSRVSRLVLTAIHNINESGSELLKGNSSQTLQSLVVRRMTGSKFTSSDLTAKSASTLATSLKSNAKSLVSLEMSVKVDAMESPDVQHFIQTVSQLENLITLSIQWNAKTYEQAFAATEALVDGVTNSKSLIELVIKARINKEQGQEDQVPPAEDFQEKTAQELKQKMETVLNKHSSLEGINLEGVLASIKVKK